MDEIVSYKSSNDVTANTRVRRKQTRQNEREEPKNNPLTSNRWPTEEKIFSAERTNVNDIYDCELSARTARNNQKDHGNMNFYRNRHWDKIAVAGGRAIVSAINNRLNFIDITDAGVFTMALEKKS
jgi:hypothetical protein